MAIDMYNTDISITLTPIFVNVCPLVRVILAGEHCHDGCIDQVQDFAISKPLPTGSHLLQIELYGKSDSDRHQALAISNLSMGKIQSKSFIWQGIYRPMYPEPWASEQRAAGHELLPDLSQTDYLGWNGVWSLEFSVPVFTWIHQIENLGWIYD